MKPLIEITNLLKNFVSQKASLLISLPFLISMPIRLRSKKIESEKRPEAVPIRLNLKHIIRKHNNLVALLFSLSLSACTGSTYSSHFDCPMGEGAGCASISRVNKMIDRQEIDLAEGRLPATMISLQPRGFAPIKSKINPLSLAARSMFTTDRIN